MTRHGWLTRLFWVVPAAAPLAGVSPNHGASRTRDLRRVRVVSSWHGA